MRVRIQHLVAVPQPLSLTVCQSPSDSLRPVPVAPWPTDMLLCQSAQSRAACSIAAAQSKVQWWGCKSWKHRSCLLAKLPALSLLTVAIINRILRLGLHATLTDDGSNVSRKRKLEVCSEAQRLWQTPVYEIVEAKVEDIQRAFEEHIYTPCKEKAGHFNLSTEVLLDLKRYPYVKLSVFKLNLNIEMEKPQEGSTNTPTCP